MTPNPGTSYSTPSNISIMWSRPVKLWEKEIPDTNRNPAIREFLIMRMGLKE